MIRRARPEGRGDVGDGPTPAAAFATLRFQSWIEKRLTPNFAEASVGPCVAASSRISAFCDGVYDVATGEGLAAGAVAALDSGAALGDPAGDGTVQCWGYNVNGQLGDGTT